MQDAIIKTTPFKGAGTTVSQLRSFIIESSSDFRIRTLVEKLCAGVAERDYLSEYLCLLRWVEKNTRYMRDPRTVELVKNPSEIISAIANGEVPQLDCDDMTGLLGAMLMAAGAEVQIVTVAFSNMVYNGTQQFSHVLIRAREPKTGRWVVLDPVAGKNSSSMLKRTVIAKIWTL